MHRSTLTANPTVLVAGSRGNNKVNMMKDIAQHDEHVPAGMANLYILQYNLGR